MKSEGTSNSRAELAAKRQRLAAAGRRRGWQLVELRAEAGRASKEPARPSSAQARGQAQALTVAKRETPARALRELASLLASAQEQGFALLALDCALAPTPPAGQASARLLASFAPCERGLHAQRIRAGLARARAQGIRLGRPPTIAPYVLERIRGERAAGKSLAEIADG